MKQHLIVIDLPKKSFLLSLDICTYIQHECKSRSLCFARALINVSLHCQATGHANKKHAAGLVPQGSADLRNRGNTPNKLVIIFQVGRCVLPAVRVMFLLLLLFSRLCLALVV